MRLSCGGRYSTSGVLVSHIEALVKAQEKLLENLHAQRGREGKGEKENGSIICCSS